MMLILCLLLATCKAWKVEVEHFEKIPMYSAQNLTFKLQQEDGDQYYFEDMSEVEVDVVKQDNTSWSVQLLTSKIIFNQRELRRSASKQIQIQGNILGEEVLEFRMDGRNLHNETVFVVIHDRTLNNLFTLIMILLVVVNTINMGAQLDIQIIKAVFKKPIGPFVGFVSQFGFMPLFSFFIGWVITEDKLFRLGLFVLGCSPGGTGSNFWTLLLDGDINMSITMTFMSTMLALGFMPLWIYSLGPFLTGDELVMPFKELFSSLIMLILPTALGMWVRWRWPKAEHFMKKIIVPFTLLTVLFIFTAGIYINLFIFLLMTPTMVLAGFTIAIAGYVFGASLAWVFGLPRGQIIAVAIETSFQNASIAFILLKISLPEPYGELAAVAPVAQLIITGWPLWLIYFALKFYKKCIKKTEPDEDKKEMEYFSVKTHENDTPEKPIIRV